MSISAADFRWRSIALPALLPTLLFSIGEGAIVPIIPVVAGNLGATLAVAGVIAGLLTIGELFGNIPSSWLIARIGERTAMIGASAVSIAGLTICLVAASPAILGIGILLIGLSTAVFALARHAFLTTFVPIAHRARVLSTLGGAFRAGLFLGPLLSAAVIEVAGDVAVAFWIHLLMCVLVVITIIRLPDPEATFGVVQQARQADRVAIAGETQLSRVPAGLYETIRINGEVLLRLGLGSALVAGLRASRVVILPLWALDIGINPQNTALIIGAAAAVDFALFYLGGSIMDRFGRLWSALPAMTGLSLGHLLLALTHDHAADVAWFVAAAFLLALANGIGSGILMTLGADLADPRDPAPFLGVWRLTSGLGSAGAPLLIAGVTAAASLPLAAEVMGGLGFVCVTLLYRYVPRYAPTTRKH